MATAVAERQSHAKRAWVARAAAAPSDRTRLAALGRKLVDELLHSGC